MPLEQGERGVPAARGLCAWELRTQNEGPFTPGAAGSLEPSDGSSVSSLTCPFLGCSFQDSMNFSRNFLQSILSEHTTLRIWLIKGLDFF